MATVTQNGKSRKQVERHVNISKPVGGVYALHMTIGAGEKARHFGYYLQQIPADFGLGFHVEKFGVEQVEGEPAEYDVHIDTERGYHSCTCKGNTYHGHCKHVEATLALLQSGRIQPNKPATVKPEAKSEAKPAPQPARKVNPVCFECCKPYADCTCSI
jgi:hypothetical protein